ncbi:MAG: response regulator transcription factor [Lachnospiraceae bacterium]|nr:response regulator transcription factor [Lachnospiraceae bacterium]
MFKILVVEDEKDLNQTVCAYLNRNGFEAIGCLSANDAYNEMYGNLFDMIISDIMMPQIDGYEFAKTVREMNQDIPILFMTAREDFESKRKGFGIGIDDYMVKPIDLDELVLRIEALLRRAKIATSRKLSIGNTVLDVESASGPRVVDVYMTKLREKFKKCNDFEIVTVHGLGYKAVIK